MTDPKCAACGHPRSNHPYRHRFVGSSLEDDVKDLEAKLTKAVGLLGKSLVKEKRDLSSTLYEEISDFIEEIAEIKGESHE